jgi:hypothetical protein
VFFFAEAAERGFCFELLLILELGLRNGTGMMVQEWKGMYDSPIITVKRRGSQGKAVTGDTKGAGGYLVICILVLKGEQFCGLRLLFFKQKLSIFL